jgi:hypothetical protein
LLVAPVKMLDVNANFSGDLTGRFIDDSYQTNRSLVDTMFKTSSYMVDMFSGYPEKTHCIEA